MNKTIVLIIVTGIIAYIIGFSIGGKTQSKSSFKASYPLNYCTGYVGCATDKYYKCVDEVRSWDLEKMYNAQN